MENSRATCPDVDAKDYPCVVILHNKHNHCQFSAAVLRFRDMAETTKNELLCYFQQGFSASHARHALETDLLLNEENFESIKSDASLLPSISVIQHLFNSEFAAAYGKRDSKAIEANLNAFLTAKCELTGSKACFEKFDDNLVVALCTPIMQRTVQLLPQANEFVLVDASSNMDKNNHRVYFFCHTMCSWRFSVRMYYHEQ